MPTCSRSKYFDQCAATLECHAAATGHDTPTRHSIQTQGRPVAVLSTDVECHTGIHSYSFKCLGSDPNHPHTPATAKLYDAVMVVVSQKLGGKVILTIHLKVCFFTGLRLLGGVIGSALVAARVALLDFGEYYSPIAHVLPSSPARQRAARFTPSVRDRL